MLFVVLTNDKRTRHHFMRRWLLTNSQSVSHSFTRRQCYLLVLIKCTFNGSHQLSVSKIYRSDFCHALPTFCNRKADLTMLMLLLVVVVLILLPIEMNVHPNRIGRLNEGQYARHNVHCVVKCFNYSEYLSNSLTKWTDLVPYKV